VNWRTSSCTVKVATVVDDDDANVCQLPNVCQVPKGFVIWNTRIVMYIHTYIPLCPYICIYIPVTNDQELYRPSRTSVASSTHLKHLHPPLFRKTVPSPYLRLPSQCVLTFLLVVTTIRIPSSSSPRLLFVYSSSSSPFHNCGEKVLERIFQSPSLLFPSLPKSK
jgi:hypothetical protein